MNSAATPFVHCTGRLEVPIRVKAPPTMRPTKGVTGAIVSVTETVMRDGACRTLIASVGMDIGAAADWAAATASVCTIAVVSPAPAAMLPERAPSRAASATVV